MCFNGTQGSALNMCTYRLPWTSYGWETYLWLLHSLEQEILQC